MTALTNDPVGNLIEDAMQLVKDGDGRTAVARLEVLERDHLEPLRKHVSEEDTAELVDRATSVGLYVVIATKDIEAGDAAAAMISLERALSAWTRK